MKLPFFYFAGMEKSHTELTLDTETSRHVIQVLRMKEGELLNLTDGKGTIYTCEIMAEDKKHCSVVIKDSTFVDQSSKRISIAISILKNSNRFEWFLEKVTELGVSEIIPLVCARTEKEKFRYDRMNAICISAMLQSQQCWLPVLQEPQAFNEQTIRQFYQPLKYIAHCSEGQKQLLPRSKAGSSLVCIGPEGDFTSQEIALAMANGFKAVMLGENRLRTETAGVVAATLLAF